MFDCLLSCLQLARLLVQLQLYAEIRRSCGRCPGLYHLERGVVDLPGEYLVPKVGKTGSTGSPGHSDVPPSVVRDQKALPRTSHIERRLYRAVADASL